MVDLTQTKIIAKFIVHSIPVYYALHFSSFGLEDKGVDRGASGAALFCVVRHVAPII